MTSHARQASVDGFNRCKDRVLVAFGFNLCCAVAPASGHDVYRRVLQRVEFRMMGVVSHIREPLQMSIMDAVE